MKKIVDIGDADLVDRVLNEYGEYIVMLENFDTPVQFETIYDIWRYKKKYFLVLQPSKRYENQYTIPDFVLNIAKSRNLYCREERDFFEKVEKIKRSGLMLI
eukprot:UN23850